MPTLTFLPDGVTIECAVGESVFRVAQRAGVAVDTSCVGKGTCGRCRVTLVQGENGLSDVNDIEHKHLGNVYFLTKQRLSCQCLIKHTPDTIVVKVVRKPSLRKRKR